MLISLSTPSDQLVLHNGMGNALFSIIQTLQELGHEVPYRDSDAPVEICFTHPQYMHWSNPDAYHILYFPFESTRMKPGWKQILNSSAVDEVWVTSPLMKKWYEDDLRKPVHIYQHGIDMEQWPLRKRKVENVLKFLHPDSSANRKNADVTYQAFKEAFGNDTDYSLTFKHVGESLVRNNNDVNVKFISGISNVNEIVRIYRTHHCLVLPSSGEGFGLPSLQSIVTGMPTIIPSVWAPYSKYVIPELDLKSSLVDSPWPQEHPGQVFEPDYNDLVNKFKYVAENFSNISSKAYANAAGARAEYTWENVTDQAWKHIFEKFDAQ